MALTGSINASEWLWYYIIKVIALTSSSEPQRGVGLFQYDRSNVAGPTSLVSTLQKSRAVTLKYRVLPRVSPKLGQSDGQSNTVISVISSAARLGDSALEPESDVQVGCDSSALGPPDLSAARTFRRLFQLQKPAASSPSRPSSKMDTRISSSTARRQTGALAACEKCRILKVKCVRHEEGQPCLKYVGVAKMLSMTLTNTNRCAKAQIQCIIPQPRQRARQGRHSQP